MDQLRDRAHTEFLDDQEFDDEGFSTPLHAIRLLARIEAIRPSNPTRNKWNLERVPVTMANSKPIETNDGDSGLLFVRIDRHPSGRLHIPKQAFLELVRSFRIDHYTLHMLRRESYGFAEFHRRKVAKDGTVTFYVGTMSAFIIWPHVNSTGWSRGFIVPCISDSIGGREDIFSRYAQNIKTHLELVPFPWFLRYIATVETVQWIDRTYENALHSLRRAERITGYGCWESWNPAPAEIHIEDLAEISKRVGFTAAALANVVRHIKIATQLIQIPRSGPAMDAEDVQEVHHALDIIRDQMSVRSTDTEYIQERARTQLQVIFNLINQHEAIANRQIAAAAEKDSAAMKVLAVMTVLFLPGTFFATLFSVPSRHWAEETVILSKFWIYLAFTLPCTLTLLAFYGFYGNERWKNTLCWLRGLWMTLNWAGKTGNDKEQATLSSG